METLLTRNNGTTDSRRALIVDDDQDFATSLCNILILEEYEVEMINNAAGLEHVLKDFPADVALIDIRLGRLNGVNLISAIQKMRPGILCIMITAYASIETAVNALRKGAYDYLRKPFYDEELLAILSRCFDRINLERKKLLAERELAKLEVQLRQSQKMETIGRLTGGIAHDFNNLLTPILGYVDLALSSIPPEDQAYTDLGYAKDAANRAKILIKQILNFSHSGDLQKKPVFLQSIIEEMTNLLRASFPSTIEIHLNFQEKCSPIMAISTQIQQVLMNLGINACHAMEKEGGNLQLRLAMVNVDPEFSAIHPDLRVGPYVRLTVRDTGYGMDDDTLKNIFQPFFTTKNQGEGTGLGLSVTYEIVRNHNGAISVTSKPNEGTRFDIYFPSCNLTVETKDQGEELIPGGDERILLVDDEEIITLMGKEMLEQLGYDVEITNRSAEACEFISLHPQKFDLIITDLVMPKMTGLELTTEILKIRPDIPIILLTGYIEESKIKEYQKLGIRECIMKPVVTGELGKAVRRNLDHKDEVVDG